MSESSVVKNTFLKPTTRYNYRYSYENYLDTETNFLNRLSLDV